ncbi:MAG: hypothetical protein WAV28_19610, partial [Sedimentisphaerales bacterium]
CGSRGRGDIVGFRFPQQILNNKVPETVYNYNKKCFIMVYNTVQDAHAIGYILLAGRQYS